ncbi:MAG: ATP-binding cassette domain-containing protein [Muribaculaceae bacterium]|nr:ATP-binding cassette domain-containing protein [Muribaculaceae bacterium]
MDFQKNKLIELTDVAMRWDSRSVLSDVNLTINQGDFIAITGPNGGGKTTLLRLILKLLHPTRGNVSYFNDGQIAKSLNIGYLPQKSSIDSHFPITLEQVIASGLLNTKNLSDRQRRHLVETTLDTVMLTQHRSRPIGELSGGQLQRGLLGRAIISSPDLLVLDEPLSYIDKHFEKKMYEIIARLARNSTIILVSHEMTTIAGMASRHLIVDKRIHECCASHHFAGITCDDQ